MLAKLPKLLAILAAVAGIGVTVYFLMQTMDAVKSLGPSEKEGAASESKPTEGGGGEGGEGHGEGAPAAQSGDGVGGNDTGVPTVSLDEIFTNIISNGDQETHTVGVKIDIELFGEESRPLFDTKSAGVKNAILFATREQNLEELNTISGKLFYKEVLVSRINEFFAKAVVRDIHFASFYLQ